MAAAPRSSSGLGPAAAAVSLLVLLLAATGLYALWHTNRRAEEALARLATLHRAQVAAVEAQVSFKTQVQEWKNLLLRGRAAEDRSEYRARFEAREAEVRERLAQVARELTALGLEAADAERVRAEHVDLGLAYRRALEGFAPDEPESTFAVDTSVRGIDRPLNDDIDALAARVAHVAEDEIAKVQQAGAERYAILRRVSLGVAGVAIVAAFTLVVLVNRARSASE